MVDPNVRHAAEQQGNVAAWGFRGYDPAQLANRSSGDFSSARRFFIPVGESKEVIFVSNDPLCLFEHQLTIDGEWRNWFTCLESGPNPEGLRCPICAAADQLPTDVNGRKQGEAYYIGYYTIIDCTAWQDKEGNIHQNTVKLLPVKRRMLQRFMNHKERFGSLVGVKYNVARTQKKSETIGDDWNRMEQVNLATVFPEAKEFDYNELLRPKSEQELREIVNKILGMPAGHPTGPASAQQVNYGTANPPASPGMPQQAVQNLQQQAPMQAPMQTPQPGAQVQQQIQTPQPTVQNPTQPMVQQQIPQNAAPATGPGSVPQAAEITGVAPQMSVEQQNQNPPQGQISY